MLKRKLVALSVIIGAGFMTASARAQSTAPLAKWEAVSIKPCTPGGRGGVSGQPAPGRIKVNCSSLMILIRQAYILFANGTMNLLPEKIIPMEKSPAWIDSDLYTIEAKAENTRGQSALGQGMMLGPMMQVLLEDRFRIKVHREFRQVPVYALTVEKDGPRLQSAAGDNCVAQDLNRPFVPPAPGETLRPFCGMSVVMTNGMDLRSSTMTQLCVALSSRVDRRVLDKTAIAGMFDIRLDWSGGDLPSGPLAPPPPPQTRRSADSQT